MSRMPDRRSLQHLNRPQLDTEAARAKQQYARSRAATKASKNAARDLVREQRRRDLAAARSAVRNAARGTGWVVASGGAATSAAGLTYGTILFFTGQPGAAECFTGAGLALGLTRLLLALLLRRRRR
ncbi:hypothetical protein [Streptomyces parvulus]|uniref:hypothetical protein n=1 Tax=Streptomyces parvulus TaxID=146923 RepID=UPI003818DDD7